MTDILDINTDAMVVAAGTEGITLWSEAKKDQFVGTFKDRVRVGRYLLIRTAELVLEMAKDRRFIGGKHARKFDVESHRGPHYRSDRMNGLFDRNTDQCIRNPAAVGGRALPELEALAKERAISILRDLPPLKKAIQVVDPDTAKMLDRLDVLQKKGQGLKDQLDGASEPIVMSTLDQSMTIGAFRAMVKEREALRTKLVAVMNEVGKEGCELETEVAKRLYSGVPGLSDAVCNVAQNCFDKSTALDEMSRRVEEQVKFGDSEQALTLLRHFEQDELQVSASVKQQFTEALEKLKLSVKKPRATKK